MNRKKLFVALFTGTVLMVNHVTADEDDNRLELEKVTVTVNRSERAIEDLSNKATVITREEIEQYSHKNIRDLVRYEPGVTVSGLGRFGLNGFNIRGIGGDRVLTLVDGVPVADEFSFGPNLSARRNFVDVDSLKAVEIVRGPASSLYGSNAIGGLVTFVTKDPLDYLVDRDNNYFASIRSAYDSVDDSLHNTFTYALGNKRWQGLALVTHRDGEQFETFFNDDSTGPSRQSADPIDNTDLNILAKVTFTPNEYHRFKFTAENFDADTDTTVLSQVGTVVFGTVKTGVRAEDERSRQRLAFEYQGYVKTAMFDEVNFNLYSQDSETEQRTFEDRLSPAQMVQFRTRNSFFEQKNKGFRLNFIKDIDTSVGQQWVYGLDLDRTEARTLRTGQTVDVASGEQLPEFSNFPTRDFPNSEYQSYGAFIQNELTFLSGALTVIPSLRYDHFELTPNVDDIYLSGNTGSPTPASYSESQLSSKFGAIYRFNDRWSAFGQFAEGFKAPPIDAVNTGFTNFAGGYTTLPNPDLRPESARTNEIGLRFKGTTHQLELSYYKSKYDDFIESLAFRGFNPATGLLEFQARNLDEVEIDGLELKGQWNMNQILDGLKFQYAYAQSDGEDVTTNLPVNTVQPQSLVFGVGYDAPTDRWGGEFIVTTTSRQDDIDDTALQPDDPAQPAVAPFETPGFTVFDLVGYYNFTSNIRMNFGLFNLSDKQYWNWNNVLLQPASSSNIGRLTQPGRNATVTLKIDF